MKFINYFGHKIAYEVKGKGVPLVFLHGFGEDRRMWSDFITEFSDYKGSYNRFPRLW